MVWSQDFSDTNQTLSRDCSTGVRGVQACGLNYCSKICYIVNVAYCAVALVALVVLVVLVAVVCLTVVGCRGIGIRMDYD